MFRNSVLVAALAALLPTPALAQSAGSPFVDDAKAGAQLRSLYFRRDLPASVQESWGLGGWVWGKTGYWRDFLQFGATVYGVAPLTVPTTAAAPTYSRGTRTDTRLWARPMRS